MRPVFLQQLATASKNPPKNVRNTSGGFLKRIGSYKRVSTVLVAFVVVGVLATGVAGARLGFVDSVKEFFGFQSTISGAPSVTGNQAAPCVPPALVYVDDDWVGTTPGTDPDGIGPATNFGCDSFATIQGGVNGVASSGTVIVNAGTYIEYVTIAQPLTLTGAGEATVTLIPPTSDPNCGGAGGGSLCGGSNLMLVQASNVTISGLTLDGDNPALPGGLPVGGANVDARNGIITDHNIGIFENLVVHHVTVKNVFLRGVYASSGGSFNFHHNTVQNVAGDVASSIAMFNFGGVGTFDNNTVIDSNDGIVSNASLGTQYTNNHLTNCGGGVHTDNAGDGPIVSNDLISGNTVDNSPVGGYGIFAYEPRATVTIQNNTVTNVDNGLASFGRLLSTGSRPQRSASSATARPRVIDVREPGAFFLKHRATSSPSGSIGPDATIFTGNTVNAQGKANSTGVTLTTDQLGNGSGDAGITFNQNTVIANTTGVTLEAQTGFTLTVAAAFNRIVSITTAYSSTVGGTLNAKMENNWWGCNAGPGNTGCGLATGTGVDFDPWIELRGSATPNSIAPGGTSTVAADMTHNSDGAVPVGTLPNIPVSYSATNGAMLPTAGTVIAGADSSTFTSTNSSNAVATITVDNQNTNVPITVTAPSFSIDDVTHNEGDAGTTAYTFTITKTGATALNSSVDYATVDGTAVSTGGTPDFTAIPTTNVVFLPAEMTKQFTVLVNGDTTFEPNEAFSVLLTNASGGDIADADGTGTITNDDAQPTITINDVTHNEGDAGTTDYGFTVSLSNPSDQTITVDYATANDTATAPSDYSAITIATLTFDPGETSKPVTVVANGDTVYELNETFFVNLTSPSNATTTDQGIGTITDDDAAPTLAIGDRTLNEQTAPGASTSFNFTVTKSGSTEVTATVNFATAPGTATGNVAPCPSGDDYQTQTGSLSFLANETTKTITVPVCKDSNVEANETFFVNLSGEAHATVTDNQGLGTILNDDIPSAGFVVNTTDDVNDSVCDAAHCSLREAIIAASGSSTAVVINFAIPAGDSRHFYYQDDKAGSPNGQVTLANVATTTASDDTTIIGIDPDWPHSWWSILPSSQLPATTKQVFIDGYSQTGAALNTLTTGSNAILPIELNGASAGPNVIGLSISGGTSTVRGLVINRFRRDGGAPTPTGIGLSLTSGNHAISGNFIGTDVSGTLDLGNAGSGISAPGSFITIGGFTPDLVNLVSGNDGDGILFTNSNSNVILGNFIGTSANVTGLLGNGGNGITFASGGSVFNTLGGGGSGEGNTIAFNLGDGVGLSTAGIGNSIRGNSIFSNGSAANDLGIDLGTDGVTANDAIDPDTGPNNLQNFPVITLAQVTGSTRTITGTLNSAVSQTFTIDFYQNSDCDDSGNGEGKTYLGSVTTDATDSNGDVSFTFHPSVLTIGQSVTATATSTGASFSTSEFSACAMVNDGSGGAGDIQFTDATYSVGEAGVTASVTVTRVGGSNGSVTANFSTSNGTAQAPGDYTAVSNFPITYVDGETGNKTVTVSIIDDTTYETNETVNLSLGSTQINAPSLPVDPHAAVLTITDNDAQPTFAIDDVTHSEGNSGTTAYTFTVTKSGSTALNANVDYATVNGTATAPLDFTAIPATTLIFLPADTTKQLTVLVNGDTTVEPDEAFTVHLSSAVNATISDADGTGTITSDDTDVTVAVSPSSVAEDGTSNLDYTFTRTGVTSGALTVSFSVGGSAAFGTDYSQTGAATFSSTSGTVNFGAGNSTAAVTIDPLPDSTFEPDDTVILTVTSGLGYNVASPSAATGTITNDDASGGIIRFSSPTYDTTESSGSTTITVERVGDTTQAVTVDYATPDDSASMTVVPCATINTLASPRCDFTTALGTLRFAAGESSKTFTVLISQDNFVEGPETLTLTLSNLTGGVVFGVPATATLTIADDATEPTSNPIDEASNFVRQHYHDFLNREPDAGGLAFWTNEITSCGTNALCIEIKRVNVSAAFYLSVEFQNTGYLVERFYKTSYSDATGTSTFGGAHTLPVPIVQFSEFLKDTQTIGQGVVVGQTGWETVLENNKQAFTAEFVQRSRFTTAFANTLTPAQFVDMLFANAGVVPTSTQRQAAIDEFGGVGTSANAAARGRALRLVAENGTLVQQEFNRAFVLMQYFGYLRRNPNAAPDSDHSGYDFWLTKLNQFTQPGDDVLVRVQKAEMVKAFIVSSEYRHRFGQ